MVATLKKLRHIHDECSGDHDRFFIPQKSKLELVKMLVQHQKWISGRPVINCPS